MRGSIQPTTCPGKRPLVDFAVVVAVAIALFAASGSAAAVPGDLDATFGTNGVVVTPLAGHLRAGALVQQSTGKLVLAGGLWASSSGDVVLVRYTTGGSIDPSFGANGVVTTDLGGSEQASSVVEADDRLVVGVTRFGSGGGVALARYLADGALDPSFGLGGVAVTPIDSIYGPPAAVALQPDGKLLVAATRGASGVDLVRLTAGGVLDPSFGDGGVTTPIGGPGGDTVARSSYELVVQPDGMIVVKANTGIGVELARYHANGTLDASFGTGGHVKVMRPLSATSLALQPDGKLVMGGLWACGTICDFGLVRLTPDGALDPSFGAGGVVTTDLGGHEFPYALVVQPNGRLVLAGGKRIASGDADFVLVRYLASGARDSTFGTNGVVVTNTGGDDLVWSLALQTDGRLVAAGEGGPGGAAPPTHFALARYSEVIAPDAQITTGPADGSFTAGVGATFGFTGSDNADAPAQLALSCSLDDAAFATCTSPAAYTGLSEGVHHFAVRAHDSAGNIDETPATRRWTVDMTSPDTAITSAPPQIARGRSAGFSFAGQDALAAAGELVFECALDGAPPIACVSPSTVDGLADGPHTFAVVAVDPAGNRDASAAEYAWTVDATTPDTAIATGAPKLTRERAATFSFSGSDALTPAGELDFRCALDGRAPIACTSPHTLTGLRDGRHTLAVQAADRAGNDDATPAEYTWTVDATPPVKPRVRGPRKTASRAPTYRFSSTDEITAQPELEFRCAVDSRPLHACGRVFRVRLRPGGHIFRVAAVDVVGNVSAIARVGVTVRKR